MERKPIAFYTDKKKRVRPIIAPIRYHHRKKIPRRLVRYHLENYAEKPIPITHFRTTIYYRPDVYGRTTLGKLDIYEVVYTESEGEVVADIVYSALSENISSLSIICSDKEYTQKIKKLAEIVLNRIHDDKGKPLLPPENVLPYITHVPVSVAQNEDRLKKLLIEKLNLIQP